MLKLIGDMGRTLCNVRSGSLRAGMYASRAALSGTRAFIRLFLGEDRLERSALKDSPRNLIAICISDPPKLLELNKGDLLVLATDGFLEWTNEEGEQCRRPKEVEEPFVNRRKNAGRTYLDPFMQRSLRFPAHKTTG